MRAETLVATHTNTDFDAFAAMLAARRLYPGAIVCLAGSLNRNVREFYRLHADELDFVVDASRLELDAVPRLIVVQAGHASPPGEAERELLSTLLDSLEAHEAAGVEVLVATAAAREYVEGVSNLAHKLVDVTDCAGLVVLVEMDGRVFTVTRSRVPELDAAALAAVLGGGGHAQAASAIYRGALDEARRLVVDRLEEAVRQPARAGDVMSRPARTISPDETVSRAMVACQRFGQSGILVAAGEELAGAVSREDLDKAISHGLSHAPVRGIMSSRVATCAEDTPLSELQRLLASGDDRVAVLRDGRLVGVVTRGDVLEALGEPAAAVKRASASLAAELAKLERLAPVFEAVAAVSEAYEGVYLVGGTVRDILLGERSFDVDIAVEGDAIALAQALADALGGRVRAHEKFGTAVVVYADDQRVDVVTARTEVYDAPPALPTVQHASIPQDLL